MLRSRNAPTGSSKMTGTSELVEPSNHEGRLIRKADTLSVMFYLYHNLGIQSCVVVSAEYTNGNALLTRPKVLRALRKVINQHPALSIIGVTRPSTKKAGNHRTWEAHLPVINFCDCVEFRDVAPESDEQLSSVIAGVTNTWFDTKDKTKPLWKVLVLNQKTVVFAFHHFISDGLSGYAFHRALTSALNEDEEGEPKEAEEGFESESVTTPRIDPAALHHPMFELEEKFSWPDVIAGFLYWILIRLIFPKTSFLFSNAKMPTYPTIAKPLPPSERTITRVSILRFPASTMSKALSQCRSHQTTFSALLLTLVQMTLAVDEYPLARFGFSRLALSVRNLLKPEYRIDKDEMVNASASYFGVHRLGRYREAGNALSLSTAMKGDNKGKEKVRELAKRFKEDLNKDLFVDKNSQKALSQCELMGEDDEEVGRFTGMALYQNNSFLVSNLGAFEPSLTRENEIVEGEGGERKWKVKDILFSVGSIRANLYGAMQFNVASVKGGDCVVCANWQDGVLEEGMAERVLRGVERRLEVLVE